MLHNNEFGVNNQLKIVENFIKIFENNLNKNTKDLNFKFNLLCGYDRCMARVWDLNKGYRPDINRRCCRTATAINLCKLHLKKNPHGRVDEYPSQINLISYYRDKVKTIENEINLDHNSYYIFKSKCHLNKTPLNLNLKNNNKHNSKMSLEIIDYKKTIETLDSNNLESDEIAKIITDKYGIKNVTIGEKKEIIENIKKVKEEVEKNLKTKKNTKKKIKLKHTKKSLLKTIELQNISELESIQLNDLEGGACEVYIFPYNNSTYVINNHKKIVGYMKEWIDEEEEVPEEFKTNDNQVLEPKTGLPMSEITISESGALYCNIKEDTYREYDYNEGLESFIKTNRIIRFE